MHVGSLDLTGRSAAWVIGVGLGLIHRCTYGALEQCPAGSVAWLVRTCVLCTPQVAHCAGAWATSTTALRIRAFASLD